jgi:hypothetical protein
MALLVLTTGCSVIKPAKSDLVYSGTYFYNFESSSFTPDGTNKTWCLSGDMRAAEPPDRNPQKTSGTAHVIVQGKLSLPGHYCNLGAYRRVLTVERVLKVSDMHHQEP